MTQTNQGIDQESETFMALLEKQQKVKIGRAPGVKTALIVLSGQGMVFDRESLKQKIKLSYPEANVYFLTPDGKSLGESSPSHVDLLIDLTGPGQRQKFLLALKLKRMSNVSVGRKYGLLRGKFYDRVFIEKGSNPNEDSLIRERRIQKEVLALAGVALFQTGDTPIDEGKTIALGYL